MKKIESSRLVFYKIQNDSFRFFYKYLSDPLLTRFLPLGEPYSRDKVLEYLANRIKHWNIHQFGIYLLSRKSTGNIIGYCGIEYVKETIFVDIRYGVIPEQWGKGFAKEAALKCIEFGFNTLNFSIIYGVAVPENISSISVLKKIGMTPNDKAEFYGDVVNYYHIKKTEFVRSKT